MLRTSASWWWHAVLGGPAEIGCQKIIRRFQTILSVLTISGGLGSIIKNIYIGTYDIFTPPIPCFLYFPLYFVSAIIVCHTSVELSKDIRSSLPNRLSRC